MNNFIISLWGRNITDERYAIRGFYFGLEPPNYEEKLYLSYGNPKEIEDIDEEAIQAKVKELEEAMHAISAKLYEAASAQMESEDAAEEASADGNDVVDADFEVVDDE